MSEEQKESGKPVIPPGTARRKIEWYNHLVCLLAYVR
jgi:hypothetical protein